MRLHRFLALGSSSLLAFAVACSHKSAATTGGTESEDTPGCAEGADCSSPQAALLTEKLPAASLPGCPNGGVRIRSGYDLDHNGRLADSEVVSEQSVCTDARSGSLLTERTQVPNLEGCPNGGTVIRTGIDANGNGKLEDAEVGHRESVCGSGVSLSIVERVAAGSECRYGGRRVRSGIDKNGDGVLSLDETSQTQLLCDPGNLTRSVEVPAGAECVAGGVRVQTGTDVNGNGVLDDSEVKQSQVSCGTVVAGELRINAQTQGADGITLVKGNLVIEGTAANVRLPNLKAVLGSVTVQSASLRTLELPLLEDVGGAVTVTSVPELVTLTAPLLAHADSLTVDGAAKLSAFSLPALSRLDHDLVIAHLPSALVVDLTNLRTMTPKAAQTQPLVDLPRAVVTLGLEAIQDFDLTTEVAELAFPNLRSAARFSVGRSGLTKLSLPALASAQRLSLVETQMLTEIRLPALRTAPAGFSLERNARLATVEAPLLDESRLAAADGRGCDISENPALTTVSFGSLRYVYSLLLWNNPLLDSFAGIPNLDEVGFLVVDGANGGSGDLANCPVRTAYVVAFSGESLVRINPPRLETISAFLKIGALPAPNLLAIDLPAIVDAGALYIDKSPKLQALRAPKVQACARIEVLGSPALPTCDVNRLANQITAVVPSRMVSGTNDAAACSSL